MVYTIKDGRTDRTNPLWAVFYLALAGFLAWVLVNLIFWVFLIGVKYMPREDGSIERFAPRMSRVSPFQMRTAVFNPNNPKDAYRLQPTVSDAFVQWGAKP